MPQRSRASISSKYVLGGLFAFVAVGVFGLWFAYLQLIGYERRAAFHIPTGVPLAARIDLEQVVLFEPVRRHVFPVLSRLLTAKNGLDEFEEATGIDLSADLREILFAQPHAEGSWFVAVGGLFPAEGVVEGLGELLRRRGISTCATTHQGRLSCEGQGFFAGQAEDGVVVFASALELLEAGLAPNDEHERLGLGVTGAAGFGLDGAWLARFGQRVPRPLPPPVVDGLTALTELRRVRGRVELGTQTTVSIELEPAPGVDPQALVPRTERLLDSVSNLLAVLGQPDFAGERTLLAEATVALGPPGRVTISAPWARQDIDRAARSLADWLASWDSAWKAENPD